MEQYFGLCNVCVRSGNSGKSRTSSRKRSAGASSDAGDQAAGGFSSATHVASAFEAAAGSATAVSSPSPCAGGYMVSLDSRDMGNEARAQHDAPSYLRNDVSTVASIHCHARRHHLRRGGAHGDIRRRRKTLRSAPAAGSAGRAVAVRRWLAAQRKCQRGGAAARCRAEAAV
jgi:hypothetical protein